MGDTARGFDATGASMTSLSVRIGATDHQVSDDTPHSATIDGTVWDYNLATAGRQAFSVLVGGHSVTVLVSGRDGERIFIVNGKQCSVRIESGRERLLREERERTGAGVAGSLEILAPMPALITGVLVAPGDSVTSGQGLVIMEAMKMENELRADRDGIVTEVRVRKGTAVEKGELLVVLGNKSQGSQSAR